MPSLQDIRQIAKEAFVYGFPLVTNYQTLYKQAVDTKSPDYRGPFNIIGRSKGVATPEDKFVVTPNSDTPYSYLWMDLRAEPVVVTLPKIEKDRYYSGQLIDLYTFNFAYLGSRTRGVDGGNYLIAGPGWNGTTPAGVQAALHAETEFAYLLFRTQLFNPEDWENVRKIQNSYSAQPLSKFLGKPAAPAPPPVSWPMPAKDMLTSSVLFSYLNFLLQSCPIHPSEQALMARFAQIDIGAGKNFDIEKLPLDAKKAVNAGIADAWADLAGLQKLINADKVSSTDMFGTREFLKNNYLNRFAGAKLGLYGNSGNEAVYLAYFVDADNHPCDASKNDYLLRFPQDGLPPAKAFWSLTMYDGKTQFLVANPLKRYLLNSTMLNSFKYGGDGSLTLYIQRNSPGAGIKPNWLPAPDGPFYAILRLYIPGVGSAGWHLEETSDGARAVGAARWCLTRTSPGLTKQGCIKKNEE
jgi:hypothetical protein